MRYVLLAFGLLGAIAVAVGVIVVATASDEVLVLDLEPGECFDLDLDSDAERIGTVEVVDCADAHTAEAVVVGVLNPDGDVPRPADDDLFDDVYGRCVAALDDRPELLDRFGVVPIPADEASWDAYDGRYVCVAIPYFGGTTTGSALD